MSLHLVYEGGFDLPVPVQRPRGNLDLATPGPLPGQTQPWSSACTSSNTYTYLLRLKVRQGGKQSLLG